MKSAKCKIWMSRGLASASILICIFHFALCTVFPLCTASAAQPVEARILGAARAALEAAYPEQAGRLEVRVVRTGGDLPGEGPIRLLLPPGGGLPRGRIQAGMQTQGSGGVWREAGWAQIYIAHFDSVATPIRTVNKDDAIAPGDVTFAWIETTRFTGEPLTPALFRELAAAPLFAHRHLAADRALQRDDVRPAYAATTGDPVEMTYRREHLLLSIKGQARSPGFVGDSIRLYAPATKTMYKVRLTGPGAAEWIETLK